MQNEIIFRRASGMPEFTLAELMGKLRGLGYKLDRSMDCKGNSTYQTGIRAGKSYPCTTLYILESDTGLSAFNVNARRDEKFKALQELRFNGAFVVGKNTILEI